MSRTVRSRILNKMPIIIFYYIALKLYILYIPEPYHIHSNQQNDIMLMWYFIYPKRALHNVFKCDAILVLIWDLILRLYLLQIVGSEESNLILFHEKIRWSKFLSLLLTFNHWNFSQEWKENTKGFLPTRCFTFTYLIFRFFFFWPAVVW